MIEGADLDEFLASLRGEQPPTQLSPLLTALWWEGKDDWKRAHEIAQEIGTPEAAWVHAYLHRKEGDTWNAGYWYRQARKPHCNGSLEEERSAIVATLLAE